MRKKLIVVAMHGGNVPVLTTLLSDKTGLDPKWPWAEWIEEVVHDANTVRAFVETGFVSRKVRTDLFWRHAATWNVKMLSKSLDLEDLQPDRMAQNLLDEARTGNEAGLRAALLNTGADARDEQGRTPLMEAAKAGHASAVRILLKAGAKVDARSLDGDGPLHVALAAGHEDIATILVREGRADPNNWGHDGLPLVKALHDRDHSRVRFLVGLGVDPRAKQYQTIVNAPLNLCARIGDLEMLKYFISTFHMDPKTDQAMHDNLWTTYPKGAQGASVGGVISQMIGFNTPMVAAIKANQPHIITWLSTKGVPTTDSEHNNLLYDLVNNDRIELIRLIGPRMASSAYSKQLHFGAEYQSPILNAIDKNKTEVLRALLDSGFPPQQSCGSTNALHLACLKNQVESLRIMLATKQMPLNQAGGNAGGEPLPPLLTAVYYNRPDCAEALLDAGANPREVIMNRWNKSVSAPGQTLIHRACETYYRKDSQASLRPLIKLLVTKAGLDINQRDDWNGLTALDLATGPGNAELAEILREFGGKLGQELGPWKKADH